jgi:FtsZ-binding cell division protein ZapB
VRVINAREKGIYSSQVEIRKTAIRRAVDKALLYTLVTAFLYILVVLWMEYRRNNTLQKIEELKEKNAVSLRMLKESEERDENLKSDVTDMRVSLKKQHLLLQARIRDFACELNFWRDTVRKILYSHGKEKKEVERVFTAVTETLGTYATRSDVDTEFQTITVLAGLLNDSEKAKPPKRKKRNPPPRLDDDCGRGK